MRPRPKRCIATFGALALGAIGCDFGAPVEHAAAGTISGRISYEGDAAGTLVVQAWETLPPSGEPLASESLARAAFPQPYRLQGLEAGEIFLTARLLSEAGGPAALGAFPTVLELSPVVLEEGEGLVGADFDVVDEGSRPEGPVAQVGARSIEGSVEFVGPVPPGAVLRGALYRSYPPRGAPADLLILNAPDPSFPYPFRFADVRDGTYFTVFYLDGRGDSPFGPGADDFVAWALGPRGTPLATTIALGAGRGGVLVTLPPR